MAVYENLMDAMEQQRHLVELCTKSAASSLVFIHKKTAGRYEVVAWGIDSSTLEMNVVYQSLTDSLIWVRKADEFFDGRFVVVQPDLTPEAQAMIDEINEQSQELEIEGGTET